MSKAIWGFVWRAAVMAVAAAAAFGVIYMLANLVGQG